VTERRDTKKPHAALAAAAVTGVFTGLARALADWLFRLMT
jgi:hypothetical protein